jgi:ParB family transcriptional regulator, chromosome partitioning protein
MRKALGRGLDALIPSAAPVAVESTLAASPLRVPLSKIRPNHLQPRRFFDPEKLAELAASIKEHGLAQPIVVSYDKLSDTYELIAGERRLRATELAGFTDVEVVVRAPRDDEQRLALALIENLQREDLNPIEEALGYLRLMKEFHISQTDLGRVMGKAKSTISNTLRLLELPADMQKAIEQGRLSEAHGRALLMVRDAVERQRLFARALEQDLSVRELLDLARQIEGGLTLAEPAPAAPRPVERPADLVAVESELQQTLGTKVEIRTGKDPKRGSITIHFFSLDDFDNIVKVLKK